MLQSYHIEIDFEVRLLIPTSLNEEVVSPTLVFTSGVGHTLLQPNLVHIASNRSAIDRLSIEIPNAGGSGSLKL